MFFASKKGCYTNFLVQQPRKIIDSAFYIHLEVFLTMTEGYPGNQDFIFHMFQNFCKEKFKIINLNKFQYNYSKETAYKSSTDSDEQETSYETQIEHYTSYIESHPDWVFAGIYADDGISGMNTKYKEA